MTLKIKTADIELEYIDEHSIIVEEANKRLIEIIDKLYSYRVVHFDSPPKSTMLDPFETFGIKK
jgi:hypothetical protein